MQPFWRNLRPPFFALLLRTPHLHNGQDVICGQWNEERSTTPDSKFSHALPLNFFFPISSTQTNNCCINWGGQIPFVSNKTSRRNVQSQLQAFFLSTLIFGQFFKQKKNTLMRSYVFLHLWEYTVVSLHARLVPNFCVLNDSRVKAELAAPPPAFQSNSGF